MRISEIATRLAKCPFPNSKVKSKLYHGTTASFATFNRNDHGIYVTPLLSWAKDHYSTKIIQLYANVTKLKKLSWDNPEEEAIIDLFYDREYAELTPILAGWASEGYNCCLFGGESDSMVLFGNIEIVNAATGERM